MSDINFDGEPPARLVQLFQDYADARSDYGPAPTRADIVSPEAAAQAAAAIIADQEAESATDHPKRRGRPRLSDEERKRHTMTFRMRTDLRAAVEELAQANGRSLSEQIEYCVELAVAPDREPLGQRWQAMVEIPSDGQLCIAMYLDLSGVSFVWFDVNLEAWCSDDLGTEVDLKEYGGWIPAPKLNRPVRERSPTREPARA